MSKKSLLEKIEVKEPCAENWDEMIGGDEARFCSHCSKSVNNFSAMTRKRALKIVRESKGNICVRYLKNPATNAPVFAGELYQIARRAPRLAVGVMATALSLSSMAYAQKGEPRLPEITTGTSGLIKKTTEPDKSEGASASISGTITDVTGAVIAGASVSLFNEVSGERRATSDENGFYEFKDVAAGKYLFKAESAGFQIYQAEDLSVAESESSKRDFTMNVAPVEVLANVEVVLSVSGGMMISIEYNHPLSKAVEDGNLEEVENLIARGEDVNAREEDDDDITPLFLAVENGNAKIAEILLNFGAKVNARDENKQTPLMRLDDDASPELVRLLIRHGAKVNAVDKEVNTALMLAARSSASAEVLQILIDHGATVNTQNKEGRTALMEAAESDKLEAVRTLILAGADINMKNEDEETAWDLTADDEIEKLLESYGAKVPEKEAEENQK